MKQAIAIVVGVLAVIGGVIFAISRVADVSPLDEGNDGSTSTTLSKAQEWDKDANGAFGGTEISQSVISMVDASHEWLAGTRPTDDFKTVLAARHAQFLDVRSRLENLRDFPYDKRVRALYLDSAQLYLETVNVYAAMVDSSPGDMRTQLDLMARRMRALADRVFDRGHALVKPRLAEPDNPDVDIRLPEEVPDWVADGLAPGPPLDDPPPPASTEPQLRKPSRPDQPRDDWLRALRDLHLPPPTLDEPKDKARALIAAVEKLRTTPDPKDDREEGARVRLSLLVGAEAERAAQAGLTDIARRLLVVADRLWSGPNLPERRSGLDPSLLRQG